MKHHTLLQEDEMVRRAIDVLMDALGPDPSKRFAS